MVRSVLLLIGVMVLSPSVPATEVQKPNIILITVDAFRPDRLGCLGYPRPLLATVDSLAAQGVVFESAFSSAAWTSPGLISFLTGRHEPAHGVDTREKSLSGAVSTLAGELVKAGYTAPDLCYLIGSPNYQNLGFNEFDRKQEFLTAGHDIIFRWLTEYAEEQQPFFLYYHYRDLHQPYDPGAPFDTLYLPGGEPPVDPVARTRFEKVRTALLLPPGEITYEQADTGWVRGLYDGQVAEMDQRFFRPLCATVRDLHIADNTVIVISADHGEELLDHGSVGHASTSLSSMLYDECIRIPLILCYPRVFRAGHIAAEQVQNIDVMPTLLDLIQRPIPAGVQGGSLLPLLTGGTLPQQPVYVSSVLGGYQATREMQRIHLRAVRTPRWKLMRRDALDEGARRWLFDIQEDPKELIDMHQSNMAVADSLEALLEAWLAQCRALYRQPLWAGSAERAAGAAVRPVVTSPLNGDSLSFHAVAGRLGVSLETPGYGDYDIEYNVGYGAYHVEGRLPCSPDGVLFGPFTPEFWNTLVGYNPWEFRVLPTGRPDLATEWIIFYLKPVAG
jgi:choline-sulfatase